MASKSWDNYELELAGAQGESFSKKSSTTLLISQQVLDQLPSQISKAICTASSIAKAGAIHRKTIIRR
jgi:hypothetical protein